MSERLREIGRSIRNILTLASKPTKDEFRLMMKITLVGLFAVGIYAFTINMIAFGLQTFNTVSFIPQIALLIVTAVIGITLLLYYYGSRKGKW